MKHWSIAVLLSKRLKDGGIKLLLVPVFVYADDAKVAVDRAARCVERAGYTVRGCSFVEATGDGVSSEGITWTVGAWVSMP